MKTWFDKSSRKYNFIFITASHNEDTLNNNLLRSRIFEKYNLIVQKNYTNIAKAYNEALVEDIPDDAILIYVHHDVFLPETFEYDLINSLNRVNGMDPNWGVIGVIGITASGSYCGYMNDRGTILGNRSILPTAVQTLDELIIITKDKMIFDEDLPYNHFYGADICLQQIAKGKTNYAIDAFCYHNSSHSGDLPDDWHISREYFANKWKDYTPIRTTCAWIQ